MMRYLDNFLFDIAPVRQLAPRWVCLKVVRPSSFQTKCIHLLD